MSDARRRWVTLAACFAASACAGFGYAWSVYLKPMAAANGWSGADVSLSYAALMSTAAAMPLVSGWALKYVRPRSLLLIGGALFGLGIVALGSAESLALMYGFAVVAGIGLGTVYPGATMANLIRYFPDRGGFASGFLTAGAGIGGMVWAPVAVWLIDEYGLPWALRLDGPLLLRGDRRLLPARRHRARRVRAGGVERAGGAARRRPKTRARRTGRACSGPRSSTCSPRCS